MTGVEETITEAAGKRRRPVLLYGAVVAIIAVVGMAGALTLRAGQSGPAGDARASVANAEASGNSAAGVSLTVNLIHPQAMLWADSLTASGPITAWQEAVVSSEIGGVRIAEVLADVGDQVHRGDLLVRFDQANVKAAVAQQQAAVAEMQARFAEAVANAERAKGLRESNSISDQDLIRALTGADAAQAQLDLAVARLTGQQLNLAATRVLAPDDGVISARGALLGAVVAPGMELFRMVRQNRLEWRAELTAAQLALLQPGAHAEFGLPDGSKVEGTVRQVAPVLDEKTRIGIAYVTLNANTPGVRAGMYAAGKIMLGERAGLALPASAIIVRDGHEFVFVVDGEGRAVETKVTTGRRLAADVEVLDGVRAESGVVASGAAFLNDGDRVRVVEWPSAASRPGPSA